MAGREPRCLGLRKCVPFALTQVREQDLSVVIHTLAQEFQIYREVGGEPVPVAKDDSSNGFPEPSTVKSARQHPDFGGTFPHRRLVFPQGWDGCFSMCEME